MEENNNASTPGGYKEENNREKKELKPKISPIGAAFIGLFAVFILYQGMGGALTVIILGFDIQKMNPTLLRLMTIAGQMLFILLPTLIFTRFIYEDVTAIVRFKRPSLKELGLFFLGFLILLPLLQNIAYIQAYLIEKFAETNGVVKQFKNLFDSLDSYVGDSYGSLFAVKSVLDFVLIIITISITPALCEEFFFRGFVQKSFELRWKPFWSIAVSSLVFSLYHFSPYGLIPLFILSVFLGFAAFKSNSIFVPVSIHFANNFFMIILYFIVGSQAVENKPDARFSIGSYIIMLFFNVIILLIWFYFVQKFYRKNEIIKEA